MSAEFPFERAAMNDEDMPLGLDIADACFYTALRIIYKEYHNGVIDRKTGETVYTYKRQYPKWGHKTKDAAKSKAIAEVEKDLRENFHPAGE